VAFLSRSASPWATIVTKADLPSSLTPYSLRHSSICRMLRLGLPVQLVARLHDTSAAMIEKNYSAQIVSLMDELAERAVIPLTTVPATVTPIAAARA
jgi:integrase